MADAGINTVFVDVGGTLLPNSLPLTRALARGRVTAVGAVLGTDRLRTTSIIQDIETRLPLAAGGSPDAVIASVLEAAGLMSDGAAVRRARQALQVPLSSGLVPFENAGRLLSGINGLGLRCFVLSNTTFMDAAMYRHEFGLFGLAEWVDGYLTSVDAGCSKPDERIFRSALELAGSAPESCAMVGNSEEADIEPAARLGMKTILVAIECPAPSATAAGACVTSLDQALAVLESWTSRR